MTNTPDKAISLARHQSNYGPVFRVGTCLKQVRTCYGVGSLYPDAATAWRHTKFRGSGPAPRGAILWWTGGSDGHGHVALATGDGYCWSTDIRRPGWFNKVPISEIHQKWGLTYVGWSYDINNVRVLEEDWFDMASKADLKDALREVLNENLVNVPTSDPFYQKSKVTSVLTALKKIWARSA